jgi:hypothetical protein
MASSSMPTWQLLTIDNRLVNYSISAQNPEPLPRRQGFNIIQRLGTGAYEYLTVGLPHPDGAAVTAPLAPYVPPAPPPPANQPPLSPSQTVTLVNDGFVDVPAGLQSGGYEVNTSGSNSQPESKSGLLWVIAAIAAAIMAGG